MLLFENFALYILLKIIVHGTLSMEIIAYISEEEDEEGLVIYQQLNVSQTYHSHSYNIHNITVKHIVITNTTSSNELCESLGNVNFLISACQTDPGQQLVMNLSQYSGIPTVHIVRRNWNFLSDKANDDASKNQIFLIPTTTVFYNVILDILPSLNLSTNTSVLFDSAYANMEKTREFFGMLPVFINFVEISSPIRLQEQLQDFATFERIIIVAKTTTAVRVARELLVDCTKRKPDCQEDDVAFYLFDMPPRPDEFQECKRGLFDKAKQHKLASAQLLSHVKLEIKIEKVWQ